jgi:hypothetical protein
MTRAFDINTYGGRIMKAAIARCLMAPLVFAGLTLPVAQSVAQGAFPAPLPRPGAPASGLLQNAEAPSEACVKEFAVLREEAVTRGRLIREASARHAGPDVACKLITDFAQSEIKMMKYLEANSASCGIPSQIGDQIRTGHKDTETLQIKVCRAAQEAPENRPSLDEILGPSRSEPAGPVGDFPRLDRR